MKFYVSIETGAGIVAGRTRLSANEALALAQQAVRDGATSIIRDAETFDEISLAQLSRIAERERLRGE